MAEILALAAAAFFALAATLWQRAALSVADVSFRRPRSLVALLTAWVWLALISAAKEDEPEAAPEPVRSGAAEPALR